MGIKSSDVMEDGRKLVMPVVRIPKDDRVVDVALMLLVFSNSVNLLIRAPTILLPLLLLPPFVDNE